VSTWAVLAAAGRGVRLGVERPKAFVRLGRRPLLAESLERLEASDWVDAIVVVVPSGWEEPAILLAEELGCGKVTAVVAGGRTRTESVAAGLGEVSTDAAAVLVHDAARPLVSDDVIERVLVPLGDGCVGVVPGLAPADTLKRVRGDTVVETLPREEVVAVQTPQAFMADAIRDAFAALGPGDMSDCASVVEQRGGLIRVVAGDLRLLKVTTPADLELVASWL
jgi:2-C-methyl-D-erythritol 4-phosphate cytidylyltransferase